MEGEHQGPVIEQVFADRFLIKDLLGKGGMGKVYLAQDMMLGNDEVALKILHSNLLEDNTQIQRFLREVQVTRKISNQYVVRTFDVGTWGDSLFLTMEYVKGAALSDKVKEGVVEPMIAGKLLADIAEGLAAIHQADVIHRDLKPGNVIIEEDGSVKITDFGIARPGISTLTAHDEIVGSAAYMAPELWEGGRISPVSDIYALGVMIYEVLVGDLPFLGNSPAEIMCKHLEMTAPRIREANQAVQPWLDALVAKMLAKDPLARPQSAADIAKVSRENYDLDLKSGGISNSCVDLNLFEVYERVGQEDSEQLNSNPEVISGNKEEKPSPSKKKLGISAKNSEEVKENVFKKFVPDSKETESEIAEFNAHIQASQSRKEYNPSVKDGKLNGARRTKIYQQHSQWNDHENSQFKRSLSGRLFTVEVLAWTGGLAGRVALTGVLLAGLLFGLQYLLDGVVAQSWLGISSVSQTWELVQVGALAIVLYSLLMSSPILCFGLITAHYRSIIKVLAHMQIFSLICVMFPFVYTLVLIGYMNMDSSQTFNYLLIQDVIAFVVQMGIQVAFLTPEPVLGFSSFESSSLYSLAKVSSAYFLIPFYLTEVFLLYGITRVVRRSVFSATSAHGDYVHILVFTTLPVLLVTEYFVRGFVSSIFRWNSLHQLEFIPGPIVVSISEYSIACALINWGTLLFLCAVLIPILDYLRTRY